MRTFASDPDSNISADPAATTPTPTAAANLPTPRRRTTVLRTAAGKPADFLKPSSRMTVGPSLSPPVQVQPVLPPPVQSVDALRQRIDPALRKGALPAPLISYTPLGARAFISAGTGAPTVVFESGLGHGKEVWGSIFKEISAVTHAVAYDRAGYGQSEASDQPRDGLQIVRELRSLLQTEEIKPPYILVGHSLGGTTMKLFARSYPNEVAGVVLVDARHAEFAKHCRQQGVSRVWYEPPSLLFALAPAATRAELAAATHTMRQARRAGPFPPVPLIVLTQDQAAGRWPERLGKVWEASQRNMAKMSRLGRMKVCEDSGHNIHHDQPDMVTTAILSVLAAAHYALARGKKPKATN